MSMLSTYFKLALKRLGFPDTIYDNVRYSLGYCQGDGVSFLGEMNHMQIEDMLHKILPTKISDANPISATERFDNLVLSNELSSGNNYGSMLNMTDAIIQITDKGGNYVHAYTMRIGLETDIDSMLDGYDEDKEKERYEFVENTLESFLKKAEEYFISICNQLERDGYNLIEGTPYEAEEVWRFATKKYVVSITREPEDGDYFQAMDGSMEDGTLWDEFQSIIRSECKCLALKASIYALPEDDDPLYLLEPSGSERYKTIRGMDLDDLELLSTNSIGGLVVKSDDRSYATYRRELVSECISEIQRSQSELKIAA